MIYPSEYFYRRRSEYVERLDGVSHRDEFREWIDFFLDAMMEQCTDPMRTMDGLRAYRKEIVSSADNLTERDVIEMLFTNPYLGTGDVMERCDVTIPRRTG